MLLRMSIAYSHPIWPQGPRSHPVRADWYQQTLLASRRTRPCTRGRRVRHACTFSVWHFEVLECLGANNRLSSIACPPQRPSQSRMLHVQTTQAHRARMRVTLCTDTVVGNCLGLHSYRTDQHPG